MKPRWCFLRGVLNIALPVCAAALMLGGGCSPSRDDCSETEEGCASSRTSIAVAPFRHDATGAYSIIHDDICVRGTDGLQDYAIPALTERSLRAGFGAVAELCSQRRLWTTLQSAVDQGHEIINHSMNHPSLALEVNPDPNYALEIDFARTTIEKNLPGFSVTFFIFPFDEWDAPALAHLVEEGYLGARAGNRGFNDPGVPDPMGLSFDVYGPAFSIYADDPEVTNVLDQYVDDAVETKQWGIRELHGVEDLSWESVPLEDYLAHLDHVKSLVDDGKLWMDTPTAVLRYTQTRRLCGTPTLTGSTITFEDAEPDCSKFETTVTLLLTPPSSGWGDDGPPHAATQEGETRLVVWRGDQVLIDDVDPSTPLELAYGGEPSPPEATGGTSMAGSAGASSGGAPSGGTSSGGLGATTNSAGTAGSSGATGTPFP